MTVRFIGPGETSARAGFGSDVVLADGWAFVSGVLPIDLQDDRVPLAEMIEAQTRKIFANFEALIAPVNLGKENVVQVEIFLVDLPRLYERMNKAYRGFFPAERAPARHCVGVVALPRGALIQMSFVLRMDAA